MSNNKLGCSYINHMVGNDFPLHSSELAEFNNIWFFPSSFEILIQNNLTVEISSYFPCIYGGGGVVAKSHLTLGIPWTVATRLLCPWHFQGKNTGVDCHFLLPRGLPNPGIKPMSLSLQEDYLPLSHQSSPHAFIHDPKSHAT